MSARATKAIWLLAAAAIAAAALGVLFFVVATFGRRLPYWGEAEVLFEASRIRSGYPLFVDPLIGAPEHGLPPSRYHVTYPPLLSLVLAAVPSSAALGVGRALASGAWFGVLAWIAATARRECRATAAAGAGFVAGLWLLANFATVGRPDALACALAGVGLARAVRAGRVDAPATVLLVLAPWVKPTLVGLPVGAIVADAIVRRSGRRLALAAAVALGFGFVLHVASGGALLAHVVRSNGQPLTLAVWLDHVPARLPFFLPLFGVAAWNARAPRREPGAAIGLGALAGSAAFTLVAMAKTGSAGNYWMEPCVAAVAVLAHAPGPFVFGGPSPRHAALALVAAVHAAVASLGASVEHARGYRADAAFVGTVRSRCGAGPGDVVASDEQGIELALNGRILVPAFQMAWLVRSGRFPAEVWARDLASPEVRCVVLRSGDLGVAPEIVAAIEREFAPLASEGTFRVLGRR